MVDWMGDYSIPSSTSTGTSSKTGCVMQMDAVTSTKEWDLVLAPLDAGQSSTPIMAFNCLPLLELTVFFVLQGH